MMHKLKNLASDSSTSTDSPFVEDDDVLMPLASFPNANTLRTISGGSSANNGGTNARGGSAPTTALRAGGTVANAGGSQAGRNLRRTSLSSPLAREAKLNAAAARGLPDDSSSDLSETPSPTGPFVRAAGVAYSGSSTGDVSVGAGPSAAHNTSAAAAAAAAHAHAASTAQPGLEDSIDVARKRFNKGSDTGVQKDKLPESSPTQSRHPISLLNTSTEFSLKRVVTGTARESPVFGLLPSTSSELIHGLKHRDEDDDSELAMAINVDVPQAARRLTFDVLVDDTCATIVRKVQEALPGLAPPANHCFTLQLANGTVCGVGKTMLDLRVQPRELVTLTSVKLSDANKEPSAQGQELRRKLVELDRVVQQKQQQEQSQPQLRHSAHDEHNKSSKHAGSSAAAAAAAAPSNASASASVARASPASTPGGSPSTLTVKDHSPSAADKSSKPKARSSRDSHGINRRHNSDAKLNKPREVTAALVADEVAGPATPLAPVASAAPSPTAAVVPSTTTSSVPPIAVAAVAAAATATASTAPAAVAAARGAKPLSREPSIEEAKKASGSFFGRIKEQLKVKPSKSKLSRLVTVPHLSLMESVQFSLKHSVGEVLVEIAVAFGMLKETHTEADVTALLEQWSLYATEVTEGEGERATLLDTHAPINSYATLLDRCNFAVRRSRLSRTMRGSGDVSIPTPGSPPLTSPSESTLSSSQSSSRNVETLSAGGGAVTTGATTSATAAAAAAAAASAVSSSGNHSDGKKSSAKKRARGGSGGKRRGRAGSGEARALSIVERNVSDDLRSSSPGVDDTSPRVALSGTIADIKASMASTAATPDTELALVQQNETLRSMLAQTLERLERATAQLSARANNANSGGSPPQASLSSGSLSPPTVGTELSSTAQLLSPRSASKLMRHTMLARTLSAERGSRLPRELNSSDEDVRRMRPLLLTNAGAVPSLTDDEAARRRDSVGRAQVPLLTRSGSFPPPEMSPKSSLGSLSLAAESEPSDAPRHRRVFRAGTDFVRAQSMVSRRRRVRPTLSDSDDTGQDSETDDDDEVLTPGRMSSMVWDGARLRPDVRLSHSDVGARLRSRIEWRAAMLEPPSWAINGGTDGDDEKPPVTPTSTERAERARRGSARDTLSRSQRRAVQRINIGASGVAMARALDEQLQRAAENRGARDGKLLAGSLSLAPSSAFDSKMVVVTGDMSSEVDMRECLSEVAHTSVYRCVVRGATFACKVFRSESATRGEREAAWREVSLLATLSHRNIVQFAGQQNVGSELRTYLEFFLTTLADVLAIRRDANDEFTPAQVSQFGLEVARALRYLHQLESPIALLSLAPTDIFYQANDYTGDVVLKIGAFTEARSLGRRADETSDSASTTSTSVSANKQPSPSLRPVMSASELSSGGGGDVLPAGWFEELSRRRGPRAALVAPELHTLERVAIQLRSDMWSFGMVLFEIIFLRSPYERERLEIYDIAQLVERGVAPRMAIDERAAHPEMQPLLRVLARCLAHQPAERPSASRLCTSLARFHRVMK
jgi:hypothetical protein